MGRDPDLPAGFRRQIAAAIRDFRPDIIHVNGTENNFAPLILELAGETPVLVQVQGLVSRCASVFWGGLSLWDVLRYRTVRDWLHLSGMLEQRLLLARLAQFEIEAIRRARYVTGQTAWQKAHTHAINANAVFYPCNHVLREAFFRARWTLAEAERHVILAPSAATPLKGFHWLLARRIS